MLVLVGVGDALGVRVAMAVGATCTGTDLTTNAASAGGSNGGGNNGRGGPSMGRGNTGSGPTAGGRSMPAGAPPAVAVGSGGAAVPWAGGSLRSTNAAAVDPADVGGSA